MTTNLATCDNPFWVGPLPEPLLYPLSHSIHRSPPHHSRTKPKPRARARPSLDPSSDNPFLNSDNPFLANSTGALSGSGSEALLKSFRESQTKNKERKAKNQLNKEEGSPVSTIAPIELDHIVVERDLKPSGLEIFAAQERVGGSSMPPEDQHQDQNQDRVVLARLEAEVPMITESEIKMEDLGAEVSNQVQAQMKTKKVGKRRSTGAQGEGNGEVMTREKKARLSKAAVGIKQEEVESESGFKHEGTGMAGPSKFCTNSSRVSMANTGTDTTAMPAPRRVTFDGNSESRKGRAEQYARYSLDGGPPAQFEPSIAQPPFAGPVAGPSSAGPSRSRSTIHNPSLDTAAMTLEDEVLGGIYQNMYNDSMILDRSVNSSVYSNVKGKAMGNGKERLETTKVETAKAKGKGKAKEVIPAAAGQVRSGRWRKK